MFIKGVLGALTRYGDVLTCRMSPGLTDLSVLPTCRTFASAVPTP